MIQSERGVIKSERGVIRADEGMFRAKRGVRGAFAQLRSVNEGVDGVNVECEVLRGAAEGMMAATQGRTWRRVACSTDYSYRKKTLLP